MCRREQGATLVVVLVTVLLMSVLGTLAIKYSIGSLKLVTNNAIQGVLQQSSDAVLVQLERPTFQQQFFSNAGVLGFVRDAANWNAELLFCFKPNDRYFFELSQASTMLWTGSAVVKSGVNGVCTQAGTSGRQAVMTQVSIRQAGKSATPFADLVRGTDLSTSKTESSERLVLYVTSVLVGYGNASLDSIKACFTQHLSQPSSSAIDAGEVSTVQCLSALNVPYSTQVAEYRFQAGFEP